MNRLSKTWKDEALALLIFVLSVAFMARQLRFFSESQKEKPARLLEYHPRREVVREVVYENASSPLIMFGSAAIFMGTGSGYMTIEDDGEPIQRRRGYRTR